MATKIKKLTREHISTYFNIGLLIETPLGVMQVSEIRSDKYAVWCCERTKTDAKVNASILHKERILGKGFYLSEVTPLLLPLASLTRRDLEAAGFWHHIDFLTYELQDHLIEGGDFVKYMEGVPLGHYKWLIKNMYDVHNLIPNKLAKDLNSFL